MYIFLLFKSLLCVIHDVFSYLDIFHLLIIYTSMMNSSDTNAALSSAKCPCCNRLRSIFFCKRCLNAGKFSLSFDSLTYEDCVDELEQVNARANASLQCVQNHPQYQPIAMKTSTRRLNYLRNKIAFKKACLHEKKTLFQKEADKSAHISQDIKARQQSMESKQDELRDLRDKAKAHQPKILALERDVESVCSSYMLEIKSMFHLQIPSRVYLDSPEAQCAICELKFYCKSAFYESGLEPTQENHASVVYLVLFCRTLSILLDCPLPVTCRRLFSLPRSCTLTTDNIVERDQLNLLYRTVCESCHLLQKRWSSSAPVVQHLECDSSPPARDLATTLATMMNRSRHSTLPVYAFNHCVFSAPFSLQWHGDLWHSTDAKDIKSSKEHWNLTLAQSASLSEDWEEITSDQVPDTSMLNKQGNVSSSQLNFFSSQGNSTFSRVVNSITFPYF